MERDLIVDPEPFLQGVLEYGNDGFTAKTDYEIQKAVKDFHRCWLPFYARHFNSQPLFLFKGHALNWREV